MAKKPFHLNIVGPQAVGKMTVAIEVQRLTGVPLLHSHLFSDPLTDFFEFGTTPYHRILKQIQDGVFDEMVATRRSMIATGIPPFQEPALMDHLVAWAKRVSDVGGETLFVELHAPLEIRKERSRSELRRSRKKTDWATDEVLTELAKHHMTAKDAGVTLPGQHLTFETSQLEAADVAVDIVEKFDLPLKGHTPGI
jgi:hypothetical protein